MKRVWAFIVILACLTGCQGYSGNVPPGTPAMQSGDVARASSSIVVHPSQVGATVSGLVMGANMATWYDVTQSNLAQAIKKAGMTATRWPGGSESDNFHWQTNSLGQGDCSGGYVNPNSTFANFEKDIVRPAKLDLAITVNYGSNPACTDGADPSEAAGWVQYANATKGYNVLWWSVGNEEYGSWETDKHSQPHNPTQYAQNVANGFYPQMKAASNTPINVCVDVDPDTAGWDSTVLA
jgi:alpha-L-arabinofuranosidase